MNRSWLWELIYEKCYCIFRSFWPRAQFKRAHLLTIYEYQIHAGVSWQFTVYGGFSNLFDFGLDSVVSVLPLGVCKMV